MASTNALILGATGTVGASAAHAASQNGLAVSLAVRDLTKPMPGTTLQAERTAGFTRVQVDLTRPDTLLAAVSATNATRAFVYAALESEDYMRSALEALKEAGVSFVVMLSSAAVRGDPRDAPPEEVISHVHARIEINLAEIFGRGGYVAVRPGFFATNALWLRDGIREGDVRLAYPGAIYDWISLGDIGAVCGAVLARGPLTLEGPDGEYRAIRLYGPQLLTMGEAAAMIGRAVGKEVKVTPVDENEFQETLGLHMPAPLIGTVLKGMRVRAGLDEDDGFYAGPAFEEAAAGVNRYTGRPATGFGEWVEENKALFGA